MSVADAEPRDIYVDAAGKLWRCTTVCKTPTVSFEEVEGRLYQAPSPNQLLIGGAQAFAPNNTQAPLMRDRKNGGSKDIMWEGWKRIHRP